MWAPCLHPEVPCQLSVNWWCAWTILTPCWYALKWKKVENSCTIVLMVCVCILNPETSWDSRTENQSEWIGHNLPFYPERALEPHRWSCNHLWALHGQQRVGAFHESLRGKPAAILVNVTCVSYDTNLIVLLFFPLDSLFLLTLLRNIKFLVFW